ncbi:MAG: UbiA family prenyltransferase [Candidatus Scalindua sp.]
MCKFNIKEYISIARPDHWFKNGFMVLGIVIAFFIEPTLLETNWYLTLVVAVIVTCLVSSSNYVINEILDAPGDKLHPEKKNRPVPTGRISISVAYAEWLLLAVVSLGMAYVLNFPFFLSALALWVMGLLYNMPPTRTKDIPYIDALSESINNPLRLCLGWFAFIPDRFPPVSLIIAYWMAGAFFMGTKRFAEYRMINNSEVSGNYRASFQYYDETKLLLSILCYTIVCSFFFGIFVVRYHLELILCAPLFAGFSVYYLKIGFNPNSSVQYPERLYKEINLMIYLAICFIAFVLLLFIKISFLYEIFNVIPFTIDPLWVF